MQRNVRAVVKTKDGRTEYTDWHPEWSQEAMDAMEALVKQHADFRVVGWERQRLGSGEGWPAH
jgi:hypothetical protein